MICQRARAFEKRIFSSLFNVRIELEGCVKCGNGQQTDISWVVKEKEQGDDMEQPLCNVSQISYLTGLSSQSLGGSIDFFFL